MQKQLEEQPGVAAAQLCGFLNLFVWCGKHFSCYVCKIALLWMRKRKRAEGKRKRDHPYVAALIVGGSVRQDEGGAVERSVTRVCSLCEV